MGWEIDSLNASLEDVKKERDMLAQTVEVQAAILIARRRADLSANDVEALVFAQELLAANPFRFSHDPTIVTHNAKCAAALAVIDRLIAEAAK